MRCTSASTSGRRTTCDGASPSAMSTSAGISTVCVVDPPSNSSSVVSVIVSRTRVGAADPERSEGHLLEHEVVLRHVIAPAVKLDTVHGDRCRVSGEPLVLESQAEVERRTDESTCRSRSAGTLAEHELEQGAVDVGAGDRAADVHVARTEL